MPKPSRQLATRVSRSITGDGAILVGIVLLRASPISNDRGPAQNADGTPRHCTYFQDQMDDYTSVVKYCRQHDEFGFDPHKVILWGYSFSGGHVLSISADPTLNIYATIAQAPYTGRAYNLSPTLLCLKRTLLALADIILTTLSPNPVYIPTAAEPTEVGAVIAPGSTDGFRRLPGADKHFPNQINASIYLSAPSHQPHEHMPAIQAPVLFIAAKQDRVCPAAKVIETSKRALKAQVVEIPGDHFDMFEGGHAFEACREAQLKFLAHGGFNSSPKLVTHPPWDLRPSRAQTPLEA
ncbi:hypothetical protein CCMSSC00406_0007427 [Pleurotus cornucopiae]|uniref:Uncharacterized protein n=1 Tax=Pleurotus cornucopiae TaxID=5321 RepID=A0ACB7J3K5_PLECO|nr:hypothetical protein CCMSSC00406_0007427 [Pleurotus cornucopiae]